MELPKYKDEIKADTRIFMKSLIPEYFITLTFPKHYSNGYRARLLQRFLTIMNRESLGSGFKKGTKKLSGMIFAEKEITNLHYHMILYSSDFIQHEGKRTIPNCFYKTIKSINGLFLEGCDIRKVTDDDLVWYVTKEKQYRNNTLMNEILLFNGNVINSVRERTKYYH